MDRKEKLIKLANGSYITCKVLYLVACAVCIAFIVLAIVIPLTVTDSATPPAEYCAIFVDGALNAFFAIGVLWNVAQLFRSIKIEQSPFTAKMPKYLLKMGVITILASTIPAIVATAIIRAAIPESELVFNVGIGGIICGVLLIFISAFFKYGAELQKRDDETL